MKKFVRYSLIGGGILLLLLIIGLVAAPYLLNLDSLRQWTERQAEARLGREVTIQDVGFSWAGPKVRLSGFSVAEGEGFGTEPFADLESFDLKLKFVDLLRLRLTVEHIVFSAPRVRVIRDESGRFNFDDILGRFSAPPEASLPLAAMTPGGEAVQAPPIDLLVEQIRIENGTFFIQDATIPRLGRGITCETVNLLLTDLSFDKPMTIRASLGLNQPGEDIRFEGKVGPLGKRIVPAKIPLDLQLSLEPFELARIPKIIGPLPMGLSGVLSASQKVSGTLEEGILFNGDALLRGLNVQKPGGQQQVAGFDGTFALAGRLDIPGRDLYLDSSRLEAHKAIFEAAGSVRRLGRAPVISLDVSSNSIPLSGWEEVLPPLGSLMKLDGDLTFQGKVRGTPGKDLLAELSFRSEKFEADRGPALMERSSSKAAAPEGGQEPLQPIKAPPITLKGMVAVKDGRFEKISFSNLKANLSQRGTRFSLDNLSLQAFSGGVQGSAWADLGELPLAYGSSLSLDDIQVNEILSSLAGMGGILFGTTSMDLSLSGKGTEFEDLKKYLTGKGSLSGEDGRLTSANLAGGAAKAASLLGIGGEGSETTFEAIKASFSIENGKVKVGNMGIETGEWSLKALGDIGLDKTLSLSSRMTLSEAATARIPEERRRLFPRESDGRVQVPLKIGGTVTSPSFALDTSAMGEAAREEVKEKIEEKKDDLKEKLKEDLGEKLKKFF